MIVINFPFKTMSINNAFFHYKSRRFKSKDLLKYEINIRHCLDRRDIDQFFLDLDDKKDKLKIIIECFYNNTLTKKGLINSHCNDCGNANKIIIDAIFSHYKKNDSCVFELSELKIDSKSDKEYFIVYINKI